MRQRLEDWGLDIRPAARRDPGPPISTVPTTPMAVFPAAPPNLGPPAPTIPVKAPRVTGQAPAKRSAKAKGPGERAIPERILALLAACAVDGIQVRITAKLERRDYEGLNQVLESLGGKWNRKAKAHVFDGDAEDLVQGALLTGTFTDLRKGLQFFPTPEPVAELMCDLAELNRGQRVLEPSAGRGDLARVIHKRTGDVAVIEQHDPFRAELAATGLYTMLKDTDFLAHRGRHERIVMNPPFCRQQDVEHVRHAHKLLKPGGVLVSVTTPSWQFRSNQKSQDFKAWTEDQGAEVEPLPECTFSESGTNVRTLLLKVRKVA